MIQRDHVHVLIQINPRQSVAKVVNLLKGGSSRVIRIEYPEIEEFLWGDSFWGDGYFAESIGNKNEIIMRQYIRNQNKS
jgi:putative transposase